MLSNFQPMRYALPLLILALCAASTISSCDSTKNSPSDTFDRGTMLQNMADNLIRPAYNNLYSKALALQAAVQNFNTNPDINSLTTLQNTWQEAYLQWQFANAYNFGPAGEAGAQKGLIEEIGTFPVSVVKLESNASTGVWNVTDSNRDARGFLAIEYLIFGTAATREDIVAAFSVAPDRKTYLSALTDNLLARIEAVNNEWNGGYYSNFITNKGADVGGSTSQLYNEFLRSFESIKNFKLGLPLGKRPGQIQTEPTLVEAYYSGKSLECLQTHLTAIENIWYGRSAGGQDGVGFREYLENVTGGEALISSTETQLNALRSALNAVPATPSLSAQITANPAALDNLYTEIQKMTRYYKSDLSSLLGIAITFSSSDGD